MPKLTIYKYILTSLIAIGLIASLDFCYFPNTASAAKKTKWQAMLEKNGVDPAIWQRYLPKISHSDYKRIKKLMGVPTGQSAKSLGPEISVGLWYFDKKDTFRISGNKAYNIKDNNGNVIAQVPGDTETKVEYEDDGNFSVSGSISPTLINDKITFDAADGDNSTMILDANRPGDDYDHFRGKIEIHYYHGSDIYGGSSNTVTQMWVVNDLPLEQYVWGMGETTGTGPADHVKTMTTIFRTYGFWYIENATKYRPLGFKIRSDSGSQIYGGYDWEKDHPDIPRYAKETNGQVITYKGEAILAAYCSYTDGKTRSLEGFAYLKSVKDNKEGKKKGLKPGDNGNHMWGLSAHGALGYAKEGKSWTWILRHYYKNVKISGAY